MTSSSIPSVAYMAANHATACALACTLWRDGECQHPHVSEVMQRKTDRCVRPLQETIALAGTKGA